MDRQLLQEMKAYIEQHMLLLPYRFMDAGAFRRKGTGGIQEDKAEENKVTEKEGFDFSAFRRVKTRSDESIPEYMIQQDRVFEPEHTPVSAPQPKQPASAPQEAKETTGPDIYEPNRFPQQKKPGSGTTGQKPIPCFSMCAPEGDDLEEYIKRLRSQDTFSTLLLKYIDLTGLTDAEIYKRAGIDRRHFSKIRCDKEYKPKKTTALALCLALRLDEKRTGELLRLAGYTLSNSDTGDLVIRFCIERGIYELMDVNEALVYFGQKAIGAIG